MNRYTNRLLHNNHTTRAYFRRWWNQGRYDLIVVTALRLARLSLRWCWMDTRLYLHDVYSRTRFRLMSREARRREIRRLFQNPPEWLPEDMRVALREIAAEVGNEQ